MHIHKRDEAGVVDVGAATEQQMVHRLEVLEFLTLTEYMVLGRAEPEGLRTLRLRAGQNNDVAAHRRGELDGQVAQTTNAHDGHTVRRLDAVLRQTGPDGGTGTHQGRGIGGVIAIRDRNNTSGVPDDAAAERAQVVVV